MRPGRHEGFTLLELMAAVALFSLTVALTLEATTKSADQALDAAASRQLRYLAEYKLGEIQFMEQKFGEFYDDDGDFDDLGEEYEGFEWKMTNRDVVVFGREDSEDAEYYFDEPSAQDQIDSTGGSTGGPTGGATGPGNEQEPEGTVQKLLEVVLQVSAPSSDGDGDAIEIVLLLPEANVQGTGN